MNSRGTDVHERNIQRWLHRHSSETTAPALTGLLVALPFSGIGYRTRTQQGVTNRRGEFSYLPDERVTFFLGAIELPAATAGPTVTPYDMGSSLHEPINVIRLLFSLAVFGGDSLSIPAAVAQQACGPIDFAIEPNAFALQPGVTNLIAQAGCPLIDEAAAVNCIDALIARYLRGSYRETVSTLWRAASPSTAYRPPLHNRVRSLS